LTSEPSSSSFKPAWTMASGDGNSGDCRPWLATAQIATPTRTELAVIAALRQGSEMRRPVMRCAVTPERIGYEVPTVRRR
jgi:hypothetical protein